MLVSNHEREFFHGNYLKGILSETRRGAGSRASPWKQVKFPKELPGAWHVNTSHGGNRGARVTFSFVFSSPENIFNPRVAARRAEVQGLSIGLEPCRSFGCFSLLWNLAFSFCVQHKPLSDTYNISFPSRLAAVTFLFLFISQRVSRNARHTQYIGFIGEAVNLAISTGSSCY